MAAASSAARIPSLFSTASDKPIDLDSAKVCTPQLCVPCLLLACSSA